MKMCAFSLPFALSTHASIAAVSFALRKSFVICPLINRNLSAPRHAKLRARGEVEKEGSLRSLIPASFLSG